jgi:hypothetical protein
LKTSNLQSLYDLTEDGQSSTFINKTGDEYLVYINTYFLMDPDGEEGEYIEVYMLGFDCKQANPDRRRIFDAKTRKTILSVFEDFMQKKPLDAFVYVCDNSDNFARNRRVTFGRWFNEEDAGLVYERYHSSIKFNDSSLYSSLIVKQDNPDKDNFVRAFRFTIKQTMTGASDIEEIEYP